jgi:hypothetical protein
MVELFHALLGWFASLVDRIGRWYIALGLQQQMHAPDSFFNTPA